MAAADADRHVLLRHFEIVGAFLQLLPEADIRIVAILRHVLGGHMEGIGLHLDRLLAAGEAFARNRVDLVDLLVRHRETARRRTGSMHEDRAARGTLRAVVGIRIADIERQVILRGRVHLAGRDLVEAFRHLAVALAHLRPELAGPAAHREGLELHVAAVGLHLPDLEFRFLLEGADENRASSG